MSQMAVRPDLRVVELMILAPRAEAEGVGTEMGLKYAWKYDYRADNC